MIEKHINVDPKRLCKKIEEIYPDIGACGINLEVEYDEKAKSWAVVLEKAGKILKTHLETEDIEACEKGKKCVAIGLQLGELKKNIGLI